MTDELLKKFYELFGENGGKRLLGNAGISRAITKICYGLMEIDESVLYDYFVKWEEHCEACPKIIPSEIEAILASLGQWEGAWALAQLHYDQTIKQEAKESKRLHKGHPLCNLALVGRAIVSPSLGRHYALLSSAGDIYWEDKSPDLKFGGLAPTLLEQYESWQEQERYRDKLREQLKCFANEPVYLEAFLASRWFSDKYSTHIINLCKPIDQRGKPFVEVLLDEVVENQDEKATIMGTRFEAAVGLLLSATPGFEVDSARKRTDEQIDLVVHYNYMPDRLAQIGLDPGPGLIECKSSKDKVSSKELRDFGTKCLFHRVKFGILVTRAGITRSEDKTVNEKDKFAEPQNAELVRRRFQADGLTLLVLSIDQLRNKSRSLRGLSDELSTDYKELIFGPVA